MSCCAQARSKNSGRYAVVVMSTVKSSITAAARLHNAEFQCSATTPSFIDSTPSVARDEAIDLETEPQQRERDDRGGELDAVDDGARPRLGSYGKRAGAELRWRLSG